MSMKFLLFVYFTFSVSFSLDSSCSASSIPVLDYSLYDHNNISSSSNLALAHEITQGLENIGFVKVTNISYLNVSKLHSISEWFFNQNPSNKLQIAKLKWNRYNRNISFYRGYYPIIPLKDGKNSYKEAIEYGRLYNEMCSNESVLQYFNDISQCQKKYNTLKNKCLYLYDTNPYPFETDSGSVINDTFRSVMMNNYEIFLNISTSLLRLIAIGLGHDYKYFEPMFLPFTLSTFRLMHSPKHPEFIEGQSNKTGFSFSTPEHTDSGFLTLLVTYGDGLQVLDKDSNWINVGTTAKDNSIVINIGLALSLMTKGRLRATEHRVINKGVDRYSIAFFFEPQCDTIIEVQNKTSGVVTSEEYGPWLIEVDKQFAEYSDKPTGMCFYENNELTCHEPLVFDNE